MKKLFPIFFMILLLAAFVNAEISVTMLNQDPDPVSAGEVVKVKFRVENTWKKITDDDVIISVIEDTPFTIYDSQKEKNLGKLDSFTARVNAPVIDFRLRVDENAKDGENELKIKVKIGEIEFISEEKYFIEVENKEINLKTFIRDSTIVTANNKGTVAIGIANAGGTNIKFLGMTLLPSDDYRLLSKSSYSYIGNLDPDDTESEDIEIFVPDKIEEVNIPIRLNYEINEVRHEQEETLVLNLLTTKEAKKIGLIESNKTLITIFVILLIVLAVILWRKFRKR